MPRMPTARHLTRPMCVSITHRHGVADYDAASISDSALTSVSVSSSASSSSSGHFSWPRGVLAVVHIPPQEGGLQW